MAPPAESGGRDSYAIPAERIATLRGAGADPRDGRSGMTPYVFHLLTGHAGTVSGTAFSPNGEILATGGADGTVRLWDTRTRETTATLPHPAAVTSVAFSPDGAALASRGADGVIRM